MFFRNKIRINMVNPIFRESKGEDPEVFLREYKWVCIGTRLRIATEWFNFLLKFIEGMTSLWFERYTEELIMDLMSLKMLMVHHIQTALIITNWRRFWICDYEDGIHNEFESDVYWCVTWLHNYLGNCLMGCMIP